MGLKKEIAVLTGGGHKGIVKFQSVQNDEEMIEGSCNLDFRPNGAELYFVGDKIAKTQLKDINTQYKVRFCANNGVFGCAVKSRTLTMFGGNMPKGEIARRIDDYNRKNANLDGKDEQATTAKACAMNGVCDNNCAVKTPVANSACDGCCASQRQSQCGKTECVCQCDENDKTDACKAVECDTQIAKNQKPKESGEEQYMSIENAENKNRIADVEDNSSVDAQTVHGGITKMSEIESWVKYDGNNFYYAVKPQLDEMFVCYPEEKALNDSVPNSKWVHVDDVDGYYVVGILYNESEPSYICYGVPSVSGTRPPQELENMCVWLPTTGNQGYWVIYQSATNGSIIR